jgi:hypothetical protein
MIMLCRIFVLKLQHRTTPAPEAANVYGSMLALALTGSTSCIYPSSFFYKRNIILLPEAIFQYNMISV